MKDWKKEIARDLVALGSIPFYILILIRIITLPGEWVYLFRFVFAGFAFFLLLILFDSNLHLGLAAIAVILTSIHYNNLIYTVTVTLFYLVMIASSVYLKINRNQIIKGVAFGAISAVAAYLVSLAL